MKYCGILVTSCNESMKIMNSIIGIIMGEVYNTVANQCLSLQCSLTERERPTLSAVP